MEGLFATWYVYIYVYTGCVFPRETTRSEKERERTETSLLLYLITNETRSPSTMPVLMAVPMAVGGYQLLFIACTIVKTNSASDYYTHDSQLNLVTITEDHS